MGYDRFPRSQDPGTDAGGGQVVLSVTATITGLTPGATYDYVIVATSSLGTEAGETAVFQATASSCTSEQTVISEDSKRSARRGTVSPPTRPLLLPTRRPSADKEDVANPNSTFSAASGRRRRGSSGTSVYSLSGKPVALFTATSLCGAFSTSA